MSDHSPPTILTAEQWGMPGPVGPPIRLPVDDVFLHHTVTKVTADAVADARAVARVGISRFGRMSYGALVHPRRTILWGKPDHLGVHTVGHNRSSVGLALVGNYDVTHPPESMVYDTCVALHALRQYGIVVEHPRIRAHREVKSTACPGRFAVDELLPWLRLVAANPDWRP